MTIDFATIVSRIVAISQPRKVVLFGSYARGDSKPTSDLDILVIAESDLPRYKRAASLYRALSDIPQPMDIIVYTPQEAEDWSQVKQAFVTTALREGKVLYEKPS
ncbi:nucleotidyltransferase domain-containing protein [candidate division KSB1 bacterium]|nr:nucleotidyltransferase domain-containing protein [candidate division KSB1 bacterium]